jgi:hypothetical protein
MSPVFQLRRFTHNRTPFNSRPQQEGLAAMKTIYISGKGDDKNDGTIDKPVYSWKRAKEVQGGDNDIPMRFLDKASAIRCKKDADRR